jgi:hypothetical protein
MKSPSTMPDMYVGSQSFELERVDYGAPEASGSLGGVQAGFPRWLASYFFSRMPLVNSDEWRAWLSAQRGATRRFIARDIARPLPRQYMDAGALPGGFDGECSDWSETINADGDSELSLEGLPVGLILSQGDYIDFRYDATEDAIAGLPWRALVRVVEGGTADGSGDVTVVVEPPVPSAVPSDAVAFIKDTGCIMALVLDQTSLEPVDRLYAVLGGTISAAQDIRA